MDRSELELYIHIPFCARKCNYCDFLSFCASSEVQQKYINQLIREIENTSSICRDYHVRSVFFGGGTPSLLEPQYITAVMDAIRRSYRLDKDAEISIECNPASTLRHKFSAYKKAGINRLSIGLQSANNDELKLLGRIHTFEEFLKCYQGARMEGFDDINVDLIDCIPMQTLHTWRKTLRSVCMLRPEHISVYNLIIEEGTPYHDMMEKGLLMLPDEEEQAGIDEFTKSFLSKNGYERYEISNYAREGARCRHNVGYWTGVPYLGFGLGASSYYELERWSNERDINRYLELDFKDRGPAMESLRKDVKKLSEKDQIEEFMFLGLRMVEGVSEISFKERFGKTFDNVYGDIIGDYVKEGLMEWTGSRLRLTDRGMDLSNRVLSDLLLD